MRLLQLVSPALPVGAYAYSQSLEYAVDAQWVSNEETTYDWMQGVLLNSLAKTDLPIMSRLHLAWGNEQHSDVIYWNDYLCALRETAELEAEDLQMGQALKRLLMDLDLDQAQKLININPCCYATAFSFACEKWSIRQDEALLAYTYAWSENQIAAAIKLVPLGQTAGQRLIERLMPVVEEAVKNSQSISDDVIGSSLPAMSLASSLHETQYSRLFRS